MLVLAETKEQTITNIDEKTNRSYNIESNMH